MYRQCTLLLLKLFSNFVCKQTTICSFLMEKDNKQVKAKYLSRITVKAGQRIRVTRDILKKSFWISF